MYYFNIHNKNILKTTKQRKFRFLFLRICLLINTNTNNLAILLNLFKNSLSLTMQFRVFMIYYWSFVIFTFTIKKTKDDENRLAEDLKIKMVTFINTENDIPDTVEPPRT